jgi:glycosyltransferase involved in cell wall biosynthesis
MSSSPLVSVVIPAFNSEAFIHDAITSIRQQSIADWELIVVNDGSTDQTLAVATQAAGDDPRIRMIDLGRNQGISAATNAAFDQARGEFIARLDSDDIALPSRLAVQVTAFRENDRLVAIGSHAGVFGDVPDAVAYCALGDANVKARLLDGLNTISGGTIMIRRAFVNAHRIRMNDHLASAEDLDYLISIVAAGGQLGNVDQVLTQHRSHRGSFTSTRIDVALPCLQDVRRRLLTLWYPFLDPKDIDLVLGMFFEPYAPYTDSLIASVRAVDRMVVARANDFGQDTSVVHSIIFGRLIKMAAVYRDNGLFNASHLEAVRCFVSPATSAALGELGL